MINSNNNIITSNTTTQITSSDSRNGNSKIRLTFGQPLEPPSVFRRHGVPELWRSEVKVIDGVEVHVLGVPREGALPHAEVEVRGRDPLDFGVVVFLNHVQYGSEASGVPQVLVGVVQGGRHVGPIDGRVEADVLPVLSLEGVHV